MTTPVTSPKLREYAVARKFVALNGRGYIALGIYDPEGEPVDPVDGTLNLKIYFDDLSGTTPQPGVLVKELGLTDGVVRDEVGKFHYDVGPSLTDERGLLNVVWTYEIDGETEPFTFNDHMQVLEQMPVYERLRPEGKMIVEQTSWFFGDMFDSTDGGPWLQENFQTHFTYERIAQLAQQATMKFNLLGYPVTSYGINVDDKKIPKNMNQLIVWGTKLECIRHLALSYTEQPDFRNVQTNITDRRDYNERWYRVLEEEEGTYKDAIKMAKRSLLNLGRGSLLVAGGIYGGGARGLFVSGMYAAQTRSMRFYPAAPSVSWGAQALGGAW